MIPWLRSALHALLFDPMRGRRFARGMLIGAGVATPGVVALMPSPAWKLKLAVFVAGGISGALGGMVTITEATAVVAAKPVVKVPSEQGSQP